MKEGGKILARVMRELEKMIKPGVKTLELDKVANDLVLKYGAKCSFIGYQDFPACLCVSINNVLVHGLPSERELKEGDIVSLDLGVFYKGYHTDMAATFPVERISGEAKKIIDVTRESFFRGLQMIKPGNTLGDIGSAVQNYVESEGFNVVRELCGHGIGREIHEDPQVLNYGKKGTGEVLKEGMVLCLEPMVTAGNWKVKKSQDGHGYETIDGSLAAHFENTILVTKGGGVILTSLK